MASPSYTCELPAEPDGNVSRVGEAPEPEREARPPRRNKRKAREPRKLTKRPKESDSEEDARLQVAPVDSATLQGEHATADRTDQHFALVSRLEGPTERFSFSSADAYPPSPVPWSMPTSPSSRQRGRPYKTLTRDKRIVANARERSRVHTISAAFESLRRAVPSYSYNQKLSKLAILRVACSYITALACLNGQDYSRHRASLEFAQCVDQCTRTLQMEGRSRSRRKE
ncbi:transcription factor atoh8-like [Branchiostoma lanceolatum]|uniref:transcription factor atoh8-like n=1 Tax=Branchiostoma lanceolatum TaxID=7740 RepID=UPI003451174D